MATKTKKTKAAKTKASKADPKDAVIAELERRLVEQSDNQYVRRSALKLAVARNDGSMGSDQVIARAEAFLAFLRGGEEKEE